MKPYEKGMQWILRLRKTVKILVHAVCHNKTVHFFRVNKGNGKNRKSG
jgi:hypothetical protein